MQGSRRLLSHVVYIRYKRVPSRVGEAGWFITVASFCILHLQCHIGGDQGETVVIIGISKARSPLFYYTIVYAFLLSLPS